MKLPCRVIEDLLPLYHDRVCSPESAAMVEAHLRECTDCAGLLRELQEAAAAKRPALNDTAPLKAIGAMWKKGKKKSFLKGALLAVLACAVLLGAYFALTEWKCIPVSADLLEVSEVSQLSDGRIIYHLTVKDDKTLHFIKFTTNEDGSHYMTPMRSLIEGKRKSASGLFNDYLMLDVAETNAYQQTHGDGIVVTACYVGPAEDGILIWEEGMALPPASDVLEQMAH